MIPQNLQGEPATVVHKLRNENGFTLVEIAIVLTLLIALMAVGLATFRGSKKSAYRAQTIAVAQQYASAISQYKLDRTGIAPQIGINGQWPQQMERGPITILSAPGPSPPTPAANMRYYMKDGIPEAVSKNYVRWDGRPANINNRAILRYSVNAATQTFTISVYLKRDNGTWPPMGSPTCQISDGSVTKRC